MNMDNLVTMLKRHEGSVTSTSGRHLAYEDSVGVITVGYGRNLDDRGLSEDEALMLLENDIDHHRRELLNAFPVVETLSDRRQEALVDFAFNIGINGVRQFSQMWESIYSGDWDKAAEELLDSKYSEQVGYRANDLSKMLREG